MIDKPSDAPDESPDARRDRNAGHHQDEFLMLGFDHGVYYYLAKGHGQVMALKSNQHVEANLIELAPKIFWEQHYGGDHGVDWKAAHNAMLRRQHAVGIYDPSRVRGCGAWWDTDHAVLHLGDRLIVGKEEKPLSTPGRYIYESSLPIRINYKNPLSAADASKLLRICELASWEKPISSKYLAGWLALAPICGALNWRPHIWIHGGSGAGKSWLFNNVVTPIIGSIAQPAQHSTTEAGLRQTLRHDAKPVIFDEADAKDPRAQMRIDNVLELARAASTEGSPAIIKGSSDGNASTWRIRSAFSFWSVNYSAKLKQDENRITAMALMVRNDPGKFAAIQTLVADTISEEYADRFLARSIRMIPVIRESARVFAAASAPVLGNQRAGDQIGALLAGAYSLHCDAPITAAQAVAYIARQDWKEQKQAATETDESKLLDRLMQTIIKVPGRMGPLDMSIGELMQMARKDQENKAMHDSLNMRGFRADPDVMVISVSHNEIAKILKDSEWSISWGKTLRRLPGAEDTDGSVRFGSTKSRGVEIPYQTLEDEDASML
jgi:putative DNA primase/helicase